MKTVEQYAEEIGKITTGEGREVHAALVLIDCALQFEDTDEDRVTACRRILEARELRNKRFWDSLNERYPVQPT